MNLETLTFTPLGQGSDWVSVGFGLITLLGIAVLIYQFNSKRNLTPSEISSTPIIGLVALATLLAAAAFIYSKKTNYEFEIVELSTEHVKTPFGKCKTSDVKSVKFYPESKNRTSDNPDEEIDEYYLVILEFDGHRHPLSSKTYDIGLIYKTWLELTQ
ncbi:MAG: hypothetical protein ACI8YQ_002564 [Polaribacter sp.]|jgi:hypothetical protein